MNISHINNEMFTNVLFSQYVTLFYSTLFYFSCRFFLSFVKVIHYLTKNVTNITVKLSLPTGLQAVVNLIPE